ncbi:MAG: gliding motility-associated C-terminal domain-containing protein [Bacteroidetes bacterium]|nr:gliding motility-associated C-terminal domain-containing protein [Bacteroidota bacterium]
MILALLPLANHQLKATHAQGADLTYTCLGGNQYLLRLAFYRDCSGSQAPNNVTIDIASVSCNQSLSVVLNPIAGTGQDVTPICPNMLTVCNGGQNPGVQEFIYEGTVTLPMACTDWVFSFNFCCRNNAISTIQNPGSQNIFVQSLLNNLNAPCNNSPTFSNRPIPFVCVGQSYCFNHGATDPDGDSLVYALIPPANSATSTVTYVTPYSATQPVASNPAMTFNTTNGDICMTPSQLLVTVMAVRVEEWRNGILIGSVVRDIQLRTIMCTNTLPAVSGINNTSNFNISVCAGNTLSFFVNSSDPDPNQNITLSWNNSIANATFTQTAGPLPVGTFTWTPGPADISNVPHCFTITVSDDNCPYSGSQTFAYCITVTGFATSATSSPANCNASNGSAAVLASGGQSPYSYTWAPSGGNNATATGLTPGTYSCTVTDGSGCQMVQTVTVTQGAAPGNLVMSSTDIDCFGNNNGSANANMNGGQQPYTYVWSNGGNTATLNNLAPGTYSVTVTTANGCISTGTVTITQPAAALSVNTSITTPILCNGNTNGAALAAVSGGTTPYTFNWSTTPAQQTAQATGLGAGTYAVSITDDNGCTTQGSIILTQPAAITGLVSTTPVSCNGGSNGAAQVLASGGTGTYVYTWNSVPAQSGPAAINLGAGTYVVSITDGNGCQALTVANISQPAPLSATISGASNVTCNGGNNGSASITAAGGTGPYSYAWSTVPVQTSPFANNLAAGTQTVSITDANGCATVTTVTILEPTPVTITTLGNDTVCPAQPAVISAMGNGGNGPYTYNWNVPLGNGPQYTVYPAQATSYIVQAVDASGCASPADTIVLDVFQFTPANLSMSPSTSICAGNTAVVSCAVTGNTGPILWNWNVAGWNTAGPYTVQPQTTTTYVVTATNVCNVSVTGSTQVTVNALPVVLLQPQTISGCDEARLTIFDNNAGNSSCFYAWDFGDGNTGTGSPVFHDYPVSGTYTINVVATSAAGCAGNASTVVQVTVYASPNASFIASSTEITTLEPTVIFTDLSSANTLGWFWNFGDTTTSTTPSPTHTYSGRGTYQVMLVVTGDGGCTDTAWQTIEVNPEQTLFVPNAFTPNGDGKNDVFMAVGLEIIAFNMDIYDRWGNHIFATDKMEIGWDGTANKGAEVAQQDVYVYKIVATDFTGRVQKLTGHVSLLK